MLRLSFVRHSRAVAVLLLSSLPVFAQTSTTPPVTKAPGAELQEAKPGRSLTEVLAEVEVRLWGRVKFDMSYDNFQGRANTDFMNYVTAEGPDEFNFNPRDTRFGLGAYRDWDDWKAKAVIEIDFYGDNAGNNLLPRLRLGYVQVDGDGWRFVVGQNWTPIAQKNPGTLDFGIQSWSGNLWWRVPQATVSKQLNEDFEVLLTAFKHRVSTTQEEEERMPWFGGRVAWKNAFAQKGAMLALGAAFRDVTVSGNDYSPWLLALELDVPIGERFKVVGEFWTGQGIGREFVRYGLDYNNTLGTEIEGTGGFLSGSFKLDDANTINAGVGIDDPDNRDVGTVGTFQRSLTAFANLKHQFTKGVGTGFELIHFATDDVTGSTLEGQRVTWSVWFDF